MSASHNNHPSYIQVDFFNKKKVSTEPYDTDAMSREFLMQFHNQAFSVGQPLVLQFQQKALVQVTVAEIQTTDLSGAKGGAVDSKMTKVSKKRRHVKE